MVDISGRAEESAESTEGGIVIALDPSPRTGPGLPGPPLKAEDFDLSVDKP